MMNLDRNLKICFAISRLVPGIEFQTYGESMETLNGTTITPESQGIVWINHLDDHPTPEQIEECINTYYKE